MTTQGIIEAHIKNIVKEQEDFILEFLRSQGYRPKRTVKYMQGLKKRLEKKGLEFGIEVSNLEYKTPSGIPGEEMGVSVTQEVRCYLKPAGACCMKCKHYIFKLMMNGCHGYCDNRSLEDDGFYVRADGYCEDFEKGRNKIYESTRTHKESHAINK